MPAPTARRSCAGSCGDGPDAEPAAAPLAVDPVCLIYTSGSTGMPKAVVSTHAQVVFAAGAIAAQLGYRADDVVYVRPAALLRLRHVPAVPRRAGRRHG